MDVANILKPETKETLGKVVNEYQALQQQSAECTKRLSVLSNTALQELGVSAEQYVLEMNPGSNTWLLRRRIEQKTETPKA